MDTPGLPRGKAQSLRYHAHFCHGHSSRHILNVCLRLPDPCIGLSYPAGLQPVLVRPSRNMGSEITLSLEVAIALLFFKNFCSTYITS